MPLPLEVTLIVVLLALAASLVPLLFQLRRTAQGLEAFLLATRKDLSQMAEDVHASRVRMDHLGVSLQVYLDEAAGFMGAFRQLKRGVVSCAEGLGSLFNPASNPVAGLLAGLGAGLALWKCAKAPEAP